MDKGCYHKINHFTSMKNCDKIANLCAQKCQRADHDQKNHEIISHSEFLHFFKQKQKLVKEGVFIEEINKIFKVKQQQLEAMKNQAIKKIKANYSHSQQSQNQGHLIKCIQNQRLDLLRCNDIYQFRSSDNSNERKMAQKNRQIVDKFKGNYFESSHFQFQKLTSIFERKLEVSLAQIQKRYKEKQAQANAYLLEIKTLKQEKSRLQEGGKQVKKKSRIKKSKIKGSPKKQKSKKQVSNNSKKEQIFPENKPALQIFKFDPIPFTKVVNENRMEEEGYFQVKDKEIYSSDKVKNEENQKSFFDNVERAPKKIQTEEKLLEYGQSKKKLFETTIPEMQQKLPHNPFIVEYKAKKEPQREKNVFSHEFPQQNNQIKAEYDGNLCFNVHENARIDEEIMRNKEDPRDQEFGFANERVVESQIGMKNEEDEYEAEDNHEYIKQFRKRS